MLDALDDTPPHAGPETDVRDAQAGIAARTGQRLADAQTATLLRRKLRCPRDCNGDNGQGERAANDRAITATLPRPCQPRCAREAGSRATWHEPGEPWLPAPGDQGRQHSGPVVGGWACRDVGPTGGTRHEFRADADGHWPRPFALSSSSNSRMSCGRSRSLVTLCQRSIAIFKTPIPPPPAPLPAPARDPPPPRAPAHPA